MRILHVQETLSPRYGGPATVLPQLSRAQAALGHYVEIVTTNIDYPHGEYCEPGWGTLEGSEIPVLYAPTQVRSLLVSWQLAQYLKRAIPNFDVIHIHGLYRFPPTVAAFIARMSNVPFIIRPHGSLDPFLYDRSTAGKLRLKRLYERFFDLPNLNAADAIHYTAEEERDRAAFLNLRSRSFVVPNGVEMQRFHHAPTRGKLRSQLGINNSPLVLFLGRLHVKKGLDILVPAFEEIRLSRPGTHLVIAGPENDAYGQRVREMVAEHGLNDVVHFVGALHGQEVVQAYADADVFVLPSYTENFGMTVVEAMACGLPVVISDQVNIHERVANASAGIVTTCDVNEVASATMSLLDDSSLRRRMGVAGQQLVAESYSWSAIVNELTTEYQLLIDGRDRLSDSRKRIWTRTDKKGTS